MKIEAVLICRDYSDYLSYTVGSLKKMMDRLAVVTSIEDVETHKICNSNNVEWVVTERFNQLGSKLDKGAGLNDGVKYLKPSDWLVYIDSDIILPDNFGDIRNLNLDPYFLYSIRRSFCDTVNELKDTQTGKKPLKPHLSDNIYGYFQMFNVNFGTGLWKWYPECYPNADLSDLAFRDRWCKRKRKMLEEFCAIHIGPERINTNGRVSNKFL